MFAGDILLNLDPLQTSTDAELWSVLRQVELEEAVKDAGGLTATVAEDGNNWSQGQRQLLCIARALIKRSRVVMLDEATASCDVTTDAMVQKVIRDVFTGCTVLTIAHRLHTIADSYKIMVLDQGEVAEFVRSWPNITEVSVAGLHFIQEDSPVEIGQALAAWHANLS